MAFLAPALPALATAAGGLLSNSLSKKADKSARKNTSLATAAPATSSQAAFSPAQLAANPALANAPTNTPLQNFSPTTFNSGGLSSAFTNGVGSVGSDAGRTALIDQLAGLFPEQADLIQGLRSQFEGQNSAFVERGLSGIEQKRGLAIGNLRENLARRRVAGSSFGNDAISRAEGEFAKQGADFRAANDLEASRRNQELINQEFTVRQKGFDTKINELNLQADIAAKISQAATDIFARNAQVREQLLFGLENTNAQLGANSQNIQQGAFNSDANRAAQVGISNANRDSLISAGNADRATQASIANAGAQNKAGPLAAAGAGSFVGLGAQQLGSSLSDILSGLGNTSPTPTFNTNTIGPGQTFF